MGDFLNLAATGKARELTCMVYELTRGFPADERFGVRSQLRRAAVSVGANIAEGCGRNSDRQLAAFLDVALGSASEVCYLSLVARDLHLLSEADGARIERLAREVRRMLFVLRRRLAAARSTSSR